MSRIATYSEWKARLVNEILSKVSPSVDVFGQSLFGLFEEYYADDVWADIDHLYSGLTKFVPNDTPEEELPEVSDDFVARCKQATLDLKSACGLEPIWFQQNVDRMHWFCTLRLICPSWQRAFEAAVGGPADLHIEVVLKDGEVLTDIVDLSLLEAADLLALHQTAIEHWASPNTLLTLKKDWDE